MATGAYAAISSSEPRTDERRMEHALRAITSRRWGQRLQPLAVHMVAQHLARARGDAAGALRQECREPDHRGGDVNDGNHIGR